MSATTLTGTQGGPGGHATRPVAARVRVKICGITRVEDGQAAAALGADALGLVFWPGSSRRVTTTEAARIAVALPAFVTTVGVFVDPPAETVRAAIDAVGLDLLQFHGAESAAFCASFDRPYVKSVRVRGDEDWDAFQAEHRAARAMLADTYRPGVPGGTGATFDWHALPSERRLPLVLAGGLAAGNVARAIAAARPDAVDVSGGVESAPGIKEQDRMRAFIGAVHRGADLATEAAAG